MRPWLRVLTCLLLLELIVTACSPAQPAPTAAPLPTTIAPTATIAPSPVPIPDRGSLETGTIVSKALEGNLLGDPSTRTFSIYLPPSYAFSNKRYPVVYVLHNSFGSPSDEYAGGARGAADQLARSGQDLILVFPDCTSRLGGCRYLSSATNGDYETYLAKELVAQIDSTYRTLATAESRGTTGCFYGADGAIHMAFKYPAVFGVTAPISANYDWQHDYYWDTAASRWTADPQSWQDFEVLVSQTGEAGRGVPLDALPFIAAAAAAAPNPEKPPFYFDMPFALVGNKGQIVPAVYEKINALDPLHEIDRYLAQPVRLRALLMFQGGPGQAIVDLGRTFDKALTSKGVDHTYVEFGAGHNACVRDWLPILQAMSDHLVH